MVDPKKVLQYCENCLGESGKNDLNWYDHRRPRRITKSVFFENYSWAVLVTGMSRKAANGWRANSGFDSVFTIEACGSTPLSILLRKVRVAADVRMGKKLRAVHVLGRELSPMTDREVCDRYFGGELRTAALGEAHASRLMELSFVGQPNAYFIIRNMGGELVKCDRWLAAVLSHFGWTTAHLKQASLGLGWGLGRADLVLWAYCEEHIRRVERLPAHFDLLAFERAARGVTDRR